MRKLVLVIFLLISFQLLANNSPLVRHPSLNSDGSKIAFTYQGDIWTMPVSGGDAERLTIHEGWEAHPIWSADDEKIVFLSNRFGNNDVFVMNSNGSKPERLTYHSSSDVPYQVTASGDVIFTSSRAFRQLEREFEMTKVSIHGGTPVRFMDALGDMPAISPNGRFVAFKRQWGRMVRRDYRGQANFDVWIYDTKKDVFNRVTDFNGNDFYPQWGDDNTLYFVSVESGTYNLHRIKIDDEGKPTGDSEQLTNFEVDGIRYYDISGDGSLAVMEVFDKIYTMPTSGGEPEAVSINISTDYRFDPFEWKTYSNSLSDYSVSPNGKYSALVIRGEIFITQNDTEKSKSVNVTSHPYRDQHVQWLSDTTLIFSSDREGQFDLYLLKSADEKESDLFKSFRHEVVRLTDDDTEETWPVLSPDRKKVVYEIGTGKLVVNDIDKDGSLSNQVVLLDGWDAPGDVTWSPDGKWLTYSLSDLSFNTEIYIQAADGSKDPVNVSMHPRSDYSPFWSKDGKKLAFVSDRNNSDGDIWFAWLTKKDWEKTKQDWDEDIEDDKKDKKKKKKKDDDDDEKKDEVEPIQIDFDGLYKRLVQVTSLPGQEFSPVIDEKGEKIYFIAKNTTAKSGNDLYSIKWDGSDINLVTKGGSNPAGLKWSDDYKYLYMTKQGKLQRLTSSDKTESIPFSANMKVDRIAEREQVFEEAWRALNDRFYDPNFHGKNWDELKAKYKPLCMKASVSQDFESMFNWMLGEINASHMGLYRTPNLEDTQNERLGYLGIEIEPVSDGVKVMHVVPETPADKKMSKLSKGDVIKSVNGVDVNNDMNFYSTLINTANERVLLEVENSAGEMRDVVIRPKSSIRTDLYNEWVEKRKELVDEYSNGRLGYLHIRGMSMPSFEVFERELTARGHGKEGIVIDVRFNGGGWTTDYLMTILNYKQHAYTIPRGAAKNLDKDKKDFRQYYPLGERLPFAAWTKPSIALCNENSYSNAEIFSHAYKNLGIGTLVGTPTFGAVISTGGHTLIDGSYVRIPFRGWFVKADDTNMDFVPAVPDIIVENSLDAKAKNKDEQLKRAVDELLQQLDN
jgi:tricorn protease